MGRGGMDPAGFPGRRPDPERGLWPGILAWTIYVVFPIPSNCGQPALFIFGWPGALGLVVIGLILWFRKSVRPLSPPRILVLWVLLSVLGSWAWFTGTLYYGGFPDAGYATDLIIYTYSLPPLALFLVITGIALGGYSFRKGLKKEFAMGFFLLGSGAYIFYKLLSF